MTAHPRNPRHRVIAQKSVFIRPPKGFIEPDENDIVTIPANFKEPLLQHLQHYHGISTEVIGNDLHGLIKKPKYSWGCPHALLQRRAYQGNGDRAITPQEKKKEYEKSIEYYTQAIELKPDFFQAYNNRGNAYVDNGE